MTREWLFILGITILAGIAFTFCDSKTVAAISWMSLVTATGMVVLVALRGRQARRLREGGRSGTNAVGVHRIFIGVFTAFVLIGVIGIETLVRSEGGLWGETYFKIFHFSFVFLAFSTFIVTRFYVTGIVDPARHKKFAYSFLISYIFVFYSGTMLLFEKFPFAK